jgi:hypothetical protein
VITLNDVLILFVQIAPQTEHEPAIARGATQTWKK